VGEEKLRDFRYEVEVDVENCKVIFEPTDEPVSEPVSEHASLQKWFEDVAGMTKQEPWLCPGMQVTIDEDGAATFDTDDDLGDGEWIVTCADGRTYGLTGVTGPYAKTERQHTEVAK